MPPPQSVDERLAKLEAQIYAPRHHDDGDNGESASSSATDLESRIVDLEKGTSTITGEDASPSAAVQDLLNIWSEIAALQSQAGVDETTMILTPQSSTMATADDPFKAEYVRSVTPQLQVLSSSLSSISDSLSSNSTLLDSETYNLKDNQSSDRLQEVVDTSNDVAARTIDLKERVDSMIRRYETVMEGANSLFIVVDERLGAMGGEGERWRTGLWGWAVVDPLRVIEIVESAGGASTWSSFARAKERCSVQQYLASSVFTITGLVWHIVEYLIRTDLIVRDPATKKKDQEEKEPDDMIKRRIEAKLAAAREESNKRVCRKLKKTVSSMLCTYINCITPLPTLHPFPPRIPISSTPPQPPVP
jgi:hypothetical protein